MVRFQLGALLVVVALASGCGAKLAKHVRKAASRDLSCSEGQVQVTTVNKAAAQYLAQACGRRAVYTWSRELGAIRISEIEGANVPPPPVVMSPPGSGDPSVPPPPPPPPPPAP